MVIAGAKGLAKEVLEIFYQQKALTNLCFLDNISDDAPTHLFTDFPVLTLIDDVVKVFKKTGDYSFTLRVDSPLARLKLTQLFEDVGGILVSAISAQAHIGHFGTEPGPDCTILEGAVITNGAILGKGCLINPHGSISHDAGVGNFVELSPGARVTGACEIGDYCVLGTNSVILPKIKLGTNVVVGAGAVVTKIVPDNSLVAGVSAVIKKNLTPIT